MCWGYSTLEYLNFLVFYKSISDCSILCSSPINQRGASVNKSNKPWEGIPTNQWYGTPPSLPEFCWKPKNQVWISLRQTTAKPWRAVVLISGFASISVCLSVCGGDPSTTILLRTLNMEQEGETTEHRKPVGMSCFGVLGKPLNSTCVSLKCF